MFLDQVCYHFTVMTNDLTPLDCALKWTTKLDKTKFVGKDSLVSYESRYKAYQANSGLKDSEIWL